MSENTLSDNISNKLARVELLDIVRGVAIIGVVIYHFMFDLRLLEFINLDVTVHPAWVFFARILAGTFLALVGFGLVFSHHNGMRWKSFWKRFVIIFVAAIAISVATFFIFPNMFVYFGILHAIAIFSVLALPFLRAPIWVIVIAMIFILSLPFFFSSAIFNEKLFSIIGLWQVPPYTADLVPFFPTFGFTLLGVLIARLVIKFDIVTRLAAIAPNGGFFNMLKKAGRWSLVIYLVHQPIMLAILYPIASFVKPAELSQSQAFYGACFSSCLETSGSTVNCVSYCQCSLEKVESDNLWETINSPILTNEQNEIIMSVSNLCSAMNK